MNSSAADVRTPLAVAVTIDDDVLVVTLDDGRLISVPLTWYPRLSHASAQERANWRLIGKGEGVHWPDIEEDVRVGSLLAGRASAEAPASLRKWLKSRTG